MSEHEKDPLLLPGHHAGAPRLDAAGVELCRDIERDIERDINRRITSDAVMKNEAVLGPDPIGDSEREAWLESCKQWKAAAEKVRARGIRPSGGLLRFNEAVVVELEAGKGPSAG